MRRTYRQICGKCNGDGYVSKVDWGYTIGTFGFAALFNDHREYYKCKVCDGKGYLIVIEALL